MRHWGSSCGGGRFGVQVDCAARDVADLPFVEDFVRMCDDGYEMGWHERNGGNASYRLRAEERDTVRECLDARERVVGFAPVVCVGGASAADAAGAAGVDAADAAGAGWLSLGVEAPGLGGEWLLITATGSYMHNVAREPECALGIVELDDAGAAYRVVWGFAKGGRPTSELSAHVLIHEVKKAATQGASRVLYHCHPTPVIALAHVLDHDARTFTRLLWKMMTECVMVFPEGVGMVPCAVPGSMELALATAEEVREHNAVVWAQHGLLATGDTCDAAFGLLHVIVKSAEIYAQACTFAGGPDGVRGISDDELFVLAQGLGVSLNPRYA